MILDKVAAILNKTNQDTEENIMKRILAIFLAVALVFSISACGTDTSEKPSEGEKVSETEEI